MTSRTKLPDDRSGKTVKVQLYSDKQDIFKCYLTVNTYEDGTPGEVFLNIGKEGDLVHGFAQAWATSLSMMFQYGVPYEHIYEKFKGHMFEPSGFTGRPERLICRSIVDAVICYLESNFPPTCKECKDDYERILNS